MIGKSNSLFFEGEDGVLRHHHQSILELEKIVIPESLRLRLLHLDHDGKLASIPGRTRMFKRLQRSYYSPLMAVETVSSIRSCLHCANNFLRLICKKQKMRVSPTTKQLESVTVALLGPLPRKKRGNCFLLSIADRFTKLTQVVLLKRTTKLDFSKSFASHLVFKYGAKMEVLSKNGLQIASKLYQNTCRALGVANTFTWNHHPKSNGQVESFNCLIRATLRCYLSDHPQNWDVFTEPLNHA